MNDFTIRISTGIQFVYGAFLPLLLGPLRFTYTFTSFESNEALFLRLSFKGVSSLNQIYSHLKRQTGFFTRCCLIYQNGLNTGVIFIR